MTYVDHKWTIETTPPSNACDDTDGGINPPVLDIDATGVVTYSGRAVIRIVAEYETSYSASDFAIQLDGNAAGTRVPPVGRAELTMSRPSGGSTAVHAQLKPDDPNKKATLKFSVPPRNKGAAQDDWNLTTPGSAAVQLVVVLKRQAQVTACT